ncbi:MAG: hypothetical protein ABSH41_11470 [Syntrophobacteraceae bacterium]|jgi:hypothetical protein
MDRLEERLNELLRDSEVLLSRIKVAPRKFSPGKSGATKPITGLDWLFTSEEIRKLPSYVAPQEAFERDEVFSDSPRLAGFWGTFDALLQSIVHRCCRIKGHRAVFDSKCALIVLQEKRNQLAANRILINGRVRLLGADLTVRRISLPDGLTLYRLRKNERSPSASGLHRRTY